MIEKQHHIVWFTIYRPTRRNAIDYAVMDELEQALTLVEKDDDAKVLVITGEGEDAFCAGGDLQVFHQLKTKEEAHAQTITAEEAERIGFVHRIFHDSLREQCQKELSHYTNKPTAVLRAYKETAVARWKTEAFRQRFFAEIEQCAHLWESEEHERAVQSFLAKRNK